MALRVLLLLGDRRGLLVGLVVLAVSLVAFPVLAVVSALSAAVSGAWLVLPSLLLAVGLGAVTAWLVLRDDALPVYEVGVEHDDPWWSRDAS